MIFMNRNLLIIFVKNPLLGKVKSRLAADIGNENALEVYRHLLKITESATAELNTDRHIYFNEFPDSDYWPDDSKFLQKGNDLGSKMKDAFANGFNDGYTKVVCIGSDLPDIKRRIISNALEALEKYDAVFGPALDGGYYLIGMKKLIPEIFENKPWSKEYLLKTTTDELNTLGYTFTFLDELNDIDTLEDLKNSSLAVNFKHLI